MRRIVRTIRSILIIPVMFLLLGLGLRLYPFFIRPFWEDEMSSYFFATVPYSVIQHIRAPLDDRPALFYLLIKAVTYVGSQAQLLRLPGLILSVLALYILYRAFNKTHRLAALCVLFLSACSLFQIDLSWQMRDYAVQIFFASMIILIMVRLYQTMFTLKSIHCRYYIWLGIMSLGGCLLNHGFIPFVAAVHILAAFFWILCARKNKILGSIAFIIAVIPSMLASGYYLHVQAPTIKETTSWIPKASTLSYVSLPQIYLGLSRDFGVVSVQDQELLSTYVNQDICIALILLVLLIICFVDWKRDTDDHNMLKIYVLFGLAVSVLDVAGIYIASRILSRELFVPRVFIPGQVIFLSSIGVLTGLALKKSIHKKYITGVCIVGMIGYLFFAWNMYFQKYFVPENESYYVDTSQMENAALDNYMYGDQVVSIPYYLRTSYLFYLWRNEKDKNYDMLAAALLNKTFSEDTIRRIFVRSTHPKIVFIEDARIYNAAQTMFSKDMVNNYVAYIEKIQTFCSEQPEEKLHNRLYIVSTCSVEPK